MRGGHGERPPGVNGPMEAPTGSNAMLDHGRRVSNAELALAAGYVVVEAGARGRTLTDAAGNHYGVAPAAIVDLKAAVRYLRHNAGRLPGNTGWIVSSGTSAGGALSALLGASGDSPLYGPYLEEIGAAEASDAIFATGAWCPIADLEHADMAYEWNWGGNPLASGTVVDATVSGELRAAFADYQALARPAAGRGRAASPDCRKPWRPHRRNLSAPGGDPFPRRPARCRPRRLYGREPRHRLGKWRGAVRLGGIPCPCRRPEEGRPGLRRLRSVDGREQPVRPGADRGAAFHPLQPAPCERRPGGGAWTPIFPANSR